MVTKGKFRQQVKLCLSSFITFSESFFFWLCLAHSIVFKLSFHFTYSRINKIENIRSLNFVYNNLSESETFYLLYRASLSECNMKTTVELVNEIDTCHVSKLNAGS